MDNYKQKIVLLCSLLIGCVLTSIGVEYFTNADEPINLPPPKFVEEQKAEFLKEYPKNQDKAVSRQIVVPEQDTMQKIDNKRNSPNEHKSKIININTATVAELDALPGIGPAIANRIVEYRQVQPFTKVEDIMLVKGIGKKKFAKMRELITVE